MRNFAIILCVICAGIYGWDAFENWLDMSEEASLSSSGVSHKQPEVFPSAMKNIVPIQDVNQYIAREKALSEQKLQKQEQLRQALQEQQQKQLEQEKNARSSVPPIPVPNQNSVELRTEPQSFCFKIGPVSTAKLPSINRSIERAGLLEAVQVESILSADSFVVFIIPTTTQKGAQALAQQMKKRGFQDATVITKGPLLNAVQLGVFSNEEQAQLFFEQAKARLNMSDLRVTRMIGQPTEQVNLIFSSLTESQVQALRRVSSENRQTLQSCEF